MFPRPAAVLRYRQFIVGQTGLLIALISQALQFGAALLLLPFVVTRLNAAEVGVWYVFVTIQSLAVLADLGFQPTISRSFAAAFAGAPRLQRQGIEQAEHGEPNWPLVKNIYAASRRLYLWLAMGVCVSLFVPGTWYIVHVAGNAGLDISKVRLAWLLFSGGIVGTIYTLWISPYLMGSGRVTGNYLFLIATRGSFAVFGMVALVSGGGLVALGAANLLSVVSARIAGHFLIGRSMEPARDLPVDRVEQRAVLAMMWPNASRMGVVALGGFLINRANVLVLSTFIGLQASGAYAISLQLLTAPAAVALLPTQIGLPTLVAARVRDDRMTLRRLFLRRHLAMIVIFSTSALLLALIANPALELLGSHTQVLAPPLFLLLAAIVLLETNHSNCAFLIMTGNNVPFVPAALLSGLATLGLAVAAARSGAGIVGVMLAQCVVQLAYNNWKWPLEAWKELR